jgi:hypothetical protein
MVGKRNHVQIGLQQGASLIGQADGRITISFWAFIGVLWIPHLRAFMRTTVDFDRVEIHVLQHFHNKSSRYLNVYHPHDHVTPAVSAHCLDPICTNREQALAKANTSSSPEKIELLPTASPDRPWI